MTQYGDLFDGAEGKGDIFVRGVPDGSRIIITSDQQIPFQDDALLDVIYGQFSRDFRPRTPSAQYYHAIAGDCLDLFGLSKFPAHVTPRGYRVGVEVEMLKERLARWSKRFDHNYYIFGNHEFRWEKEMYEGRLSQYTRRLHEVLELEALGYDWVPYGRHVDFEGFIITHGNSTALHAAKVELTNYQSSGVSGHTNRPQDYTTASASNGEPSTWYSLGMTCRNDIGSVIKVWSQTQRWQQCFGIGQVQNGVLYFNSVRVHHGGFWANGKFYPVAPGA